MFIRAPLARWRHRRTTESDDRSDSFRKNLHAQAGAILGVIHLYTRLHRRPPAEAGIQQYFRVTPPSVHQMVLTLERAGFIRRQPGAALSIEVLVDPKYLPELL
jgi:DNA-binding MarR family transcriptional regulator